MTAGFEAGAAQDKYWSERVGSMRAVACLVLLASLAGCSDPAPEASASGPAATDSSGTDLGRANDVGAPAAVVRVQDPVQFHGVIGSGVCFYDGTGIQCTNTPAATAPTAMGSNVLRYDHARSGDLQGGNLTLSWSPAIGAGLHASARVYDGCPDDCMLNTTLGEGSWSLDDDPALEASVTFPVAAFAMQPDQVLSVRIAPRLLTGPLSAHAGFEVDLAGTLDFDVPA